MMQEYSEESKGVKHASLLHSVRKSSITKACKKAPVAPMPPNPIKVYKVDPINFRDLVQHLTGAPQFKPHAPPMPHSLLLQQNFSPITTLNSSFVDHPQTTDINNIHVTEPSSNFSDWQSKPSFSNLYHPQDLQSQPMGMGLMKSLLS